MAPGRGRDSPAVHGRSPGDPPSWYRAGPAELPGSTRGALSQTAAAGPSRDARCCPARTPGSFPPRARPLPSAARRSTHGYGAAQPGTTDGHGPGSVPVPAAPTLLTGPLPAASSASPVLRTLPARQSDPCPVPPAYCRSPPVPHARCSLTRLHSPLLPVPRPAHRCSPCPVRQSSSLPPPVPGAPAPLTAPPRSFPVLRLHSPSLPARSRYPGPAHRRSPPPARSCPNKRRAAPRAPPRPP